MSRQDRPIGVLAYDHGEPVGWAAVGPREDYPRLNRGRDTAAVDAEAVWVVPCFFVTPSHRGLGVTRALLCAATRLAHEHGALALEGVPGDPATKSCTASASYTGIVALFEAQGFAEIARRTPKGRVVMRKALTDESVNS